MPDIIGLIPARAGSKRIVDKNIRDLAGHPLLAYSIASALESGIFKKVLVSTDSARYGIIAEHYGADVLYRPPKMASDTSPDIEWVTHALRVVPEYDAFAILRPTSPFRKAATIQRAWAQFQVADVNSIRAVEKCHEHPAKMWTIRNGILHNLMPFGPEDQPWHSSQYPTLPPVYVQNASLEIAWTKVALNMDSIAGEVIGAFLTYGDEGFDVNTVHDFRIAELMVESGEATLPAIRRAAFVGATK